MDPKRTEETTTETTETETTTTEERPAEPEVRQEVHTVEITPPARD